MSKNQPRKSQEANASRRRRQHEAEAGAAGALAGAVMGAVGGPPGAVAGAILGGIVGAMAAGVVEKDLVAAAVAATEVDAALGVFGGDIGAPNLEHPPESVGAYSSGSSGAPPSGDSAPAEGPMQNLES